MTNPIAQIIQRYLTGSISPEEEVELQAWLAANKNNRKLLESFRDAKNIQDDLDFFASIDEDKAWKKTRSKQTSAGNRPMRKFLSVAAAIVLAVGVFIVWKFNLGNHAPNEPQAAISHVSDIAPAKSGALLLMADGSQVELAGNSQKVIGSAKNVFGNSEELTIKPVEKQIPLQYNTLIIPKASYYRMTLSDGTKVWVNALSQLRFPVQFAKHERRVFLDGEAYFEVAHKSDQPFIVETGGTEIKVLGTHFNVNSYNDQIRTTLAAGKVEVKRGQDVMELSPGEYSLFSNNQFTKGKADLSHDLAWHNNEFYFKKETIVSIAHQLSRWYDLDVKFRGNVQFDKEYTGSIERDVQLSQVLEMLSYVSNLKFEVEGRKLSIETKN
ncbi:FecR domain-containing protein [Sphingobacterium sp. N143]|uniref:FecR family protein n=1 Tax=Sphingobacterium sp. N143 TaxID=2746727 RepID=UPI00257695E8|nr:FecR family protein [Sphingobacterium sp. N143]MDM1293528.1 FecR domain-containing protein [Sphingobacterium sp. N143]